MVEDENESKPPNRVEQTEDGRFQAFWNGRPTQQPFAREDFAWAQIAACERAGKEIG